MAGGARARMYVLRLFGGLSLEGDGSPVPPAALQRRRLTLLALIALAGDRGVARERAQAHLWPDADPDRARHALDQLLYTTRRDLGSDALLSDASSLRLNPAVIRADVARFDAALRAGRWEEAAALYAGPLLDGIRLLDGPELGRWIEMERARCEQGYRRALETLAREAATDGRTTDATRWWRRLAAADPRCAPVAMELMRALARAGDVPAAVAHARVYERLVTEAGGGVPDPAVAALARVLAAERTDPPSTTVPPEPDGARPPATGHAGVPSSAPPVREGPRPGRRWPAGLLAAGAGLALVVIVSPDAGGSGAVRNAGADVRPAMAVAHGELAAEAPPSAPADARAELPADPVTRELYLRATARWEQRDRAGLEEAVTLYRAVAERSPGHAPAFAGLALSYAMLGYFGFAPGDAMFPKAGAAAERALALDPRSGGALAALGQSLAWEHRWADAERVYRRALEASPGNATVHQWYALLLAYLGRAEAAAVHTAHASRLDPLSVQIGNMHGMMLYHAGDLAGALRHYERTVEDEPDSAWVMRNPWVLSNYGRVTGVAGRHAKAEAMLERAARAVPGHPRPLLDLVFVHVRAGDSAKARRAFARSDMAHAHYPAYRGLFHALVGERDTALQWLGRVDEMPLPAMILMRNDPGLAAFRADPRYAAVLERLTAPRRR